VAFVPASQLRLGRRFHQVVGASCAVACTLSAQVTLQPRARPAILLPPLTLSIEPRRRGILSLQLPPAARRALRGRKGVRISVAVTITTADGVAHTDTLSRRARLGPLTTV
jgi:hypothetical protein